jgi:hypothetical protein
MSDSTSFVSELTEKLAGHLPIIRETSAMLISQLSSTGTDVDDIVKTIRRDQAFVARVLVIANSPYYHRSPEKITTIKAAILRIGYDVIRDIAIAAEFVELVHRSAESAPRLGRLLARAFVAAHQTISLCDEIGLRDSETLFTTALLESLGEVALAVHMPDIYEDILCRAHTEDLGYDDAHRLVTCRGPHDLTILVADIHTLPKDLILAPPDWETEDWADSNRGAAIVHLTNACARNLFTPDSPRAREDFDEVMALAARALGVPTTMLMELLSGAFEKALEFGIDVNLGYRYFAIEDPSINEVPRQKLMKKLAAGYTRTTSKAFEIAYRLYSLPI